MRQIVLRAVLLLVAWAIGLLLAASVVPGVSLSVSGFIVAVVVFSAAQAILSWWILRLPHGYGSLLLGGTGLVLTVFALSFAAAFTHGFTIRGMASWLATTLVVWLVTTIGAVSLPEVLGRQSAGST
jgi:Mycobacterial 4 TMS phage holin, superfamily IV